MTTSKLSQYIALFVTSLAAMLVAMTLFVGLKASMFNKPIIIPTVNEFVVLNPGKQVSPGSVLKYRIQYKKLLDYPGDLTKQLIVEPFDGGDTVYIPLDNVAGHLPAGDINAIGLATIPAWTPEGNARIKLSTIYHVNYFLPPAIVYTEDFKVIRCPNN